MNAEEMSREQISAVADGEFTDRQLAEVLTALRNKDAQETWDVYHQIGDVLRSDDMAVTLSSGFSARMAARLDAEPTIVAPAGPVGSSVTSDLPKDSGKRHANRWMMPGMAAAAAMATIAFVATPQLMVAFNGSDASTGGEPIIALTANAVTGKVVPAAAELDQHAGVVSSVPDGVVLRDPRIDDYLLAHQRFSPSVYSTAQYARSVTLATDSNK